MKHVLRRSSLTLLPALLLALAAGGGALAQSADDLEPDITTRQEADRTIREYRINGELYAIEIRPSAGSPFYLVDRDGDGDFERQADDRITVPEWVLETL